MDILKESSDFRDLIRKDLSEVLKADSYVLIFDSSLEDQELSKNWVFRLVYKGSSTIEIFNDDWRDYTEYFNVSADGKELFHLKITEYETLTAAFDVLKSKIQKLLG